MVGLAIVSSAISLGNRTFNDTYKSTITLLDRTSRPAILKDLEAKQLSNEIVASFLAHELGLSTPNAFLAFDRHNLTNATKGPVHNGSQILFASEDVLVPDLSVKFRLGGRLNSPAIKSALLAEAQTGPTIAFDEWIANIDRHIGNILLGQPGKMWLIDHGHAFTGPNWNGRDLDENRKYKNRLVDALTADMTEAHKNNYMNDSVSIVSAANDIDISAVLDNNFVESFLSNADYNALRDFLNQRRDNIEALTRTALGLVA